MTRLNERNLKILSQVHRLQSSGNLLWCRGEWLGRLEAADWGIMVAVLTSTWFWWQLKRSNRIKRPMLARQTPVLPALKMICLRVTGRPSNTGPCQKTLEMPSTWHSQRRSTQTFGTNFGFSTTKSTSLPQFSMTEFPVTNKDGTQKRNRCWRRSSSAKGCCLKKRCDIWKRRWIRKLRAPMM